MSDKLIERWLDGATAALPAAQRARAREELRDHYLSRRDDYLRQGAAPGEASAKAMADLGGASLTASAFESAARPRWRVWFDWLGWLLGVGAMLALGWWNRLTTMFLLYVWLVPWDTTFDRPPRGTLFRIINDSVEGRVVPLSWLLMAPFAAVAAWSLWRGRHSPGLPWRWVAIQLWWWWSWLVIHVLGSGLVILLPAGAFNTDLAIAGCACALSLAVVSGLLLRRMIRLTRQLRPDDLPPAIAPQSA